MNASQSRYEDPEFQKMLENAFEAERRYFAEPGTLLSTDNGIPKDFHLSKYKNKSLSSNTLPKQNLLEKQTEDYTYQLQPNNHVENNLDFTLQPHSQHSGISQSEDMNSKRSIT
jgi:hypothetical protein